MNGPAAPPSRTWASDPSMTSDAPATTSQKMKSRIPADRVDRNARVVLDRASDPPQGQAEKDGAARDRSEEGRLPRAHPETSVKAA